MPHARFNDIKLCYESHGDGEPLVLISGFGCDRTIWSLVRPKLTGKFRVIVFDNRGMGQSSGADTVTIIRQMAEDTAGLLDALGIASAPIAGHSMAGLIAQELALAFPAKVRSLILLATCARLDQRGQAIIESWGDLPRHADPETTTRLILPWLYTNAFYARPGAIDEIIQLVLADPHPPTAVTLWQQSRAISAANTTDRLGRIRCPTLVIAGRDDILLPVEFSNVLARGIPGAELTVLEKSGHGMLIETPEAVADAMLTFLRTGNASSE